MNLTLFDFLDNAFEYLPYHSFDWRWSMENGYPLYQNGLKVFSCFACAGGSTMGYKLAGCDVLGCLEIDKKVNYVYKKNHSPKYNYLMDIRDFNNLVDLPDDLFNLDILDGSPPCTTFSIAGDRADSWGKVKKFREGQAQQSLDDLPFVFINTVAKLRPKVVIMENVPGIFFGDAWGYVQKIYTQFHSIGYQVKHWLLKSENMGVPQKRHRVFFIATRLDFDLDKIDFSFNYVPIFFGDVKQGFGDIPKCSYLLNKAVPGDTCLADVIFREYQIWSRFSESIVWDNMICPTIHHHGFYRGNDKTKFTTEDYRNCSTFPFDFDWCGCSVPYICGMSVPPVMIKRIVSRLITSGLFDYKFRALH